MKMSILWPCLVEFDTEETGES